MGAALNGVKNLQDLYALAGAKSIAFSSEALDELALIVTRLAGDVLVLGSDERLVLSVAKAGVMKPGDLMRIYAQSLSDEKGSCKSPSSFDPFGDQKTLGYLRNHYLEINPLYVKMLEHLSFALGLPSALAYLASSKFVGYPELLTVHRLLFQNLYPWAGLDRMATAPELLISKGASGAPGSVSFAQPGEIARSAEYAFRGSEASKHVRRSSGAILGNLAYAHPFLDGNGRALLPIHIELCYRAGFAITWGVIDTAEYLSVLSREIDQPSKGYMDDFLRQYVVDVSSRDSCINAIIGTASSN